MSPDISLVKLVRRAISGLLGPGSPSNLNAITLGAEGLAIVCGMFNPKLITMSWSTKKCNAFMKKVSHHGTGVKINVSLWL